GMTARILSSPTRTRPRPSLLRVPTQTEPSGATVTARSLPYSPDQCATGTPGEPSSASGICHSRSPRSAPIHSDPFAYASPDGEASEVSQVTIGFLYAGSSPRPSTRGQP